MIYVINECILFEKNKNILQVDIPINHPSLFLFSLPPSSKDSQESQCGMDGSGAYSRYSIQLLVPHYAGGTTRVPSGPGLHHRDDPMTYTSTLLWPTSCAWWLVGVQIPLMNYRYIMCRGFYPLLQSRPQIYCTIHLVWDLPPNLIPPYHLLTGTCGPFLSLRQQQFSL